jgi:hypothetical protein
MSSYSDVSGIIAIWLLFSSCSAQRRRRRRQPFRFWHVDRRSGDFGNRLILVGHNGETVTSALRSSERLGASGDGARGLMIQVTSERSARGNANRNTRGHVPDGDHCVALSCSF